MEACGWWNIRVFVFITMPQTELVRGVVELDDHGYVVTHDYLRPRFPACTRRAIAGQNLR